MLVRVAIATEPDARVDVSGPGAVDAVARGLTTMGRTDARGQLTLRFPYIFAAGTRRRSSPSSSW